MKLLGLILACLIVTIQYPLWLGKGGWMRVWDVERKLAVQRAENGQLERRNGALGAEVNDLKQGMEAIEERGGGCVIVVHAQDVEIAAVLVPVARVCGAPIKNEPVDVCLRNVCALIWAHRPVNLTTDRVKLAKRHLRQVFQSF